MSPTTVSRRRPSRSHSGSSTTGGAFVQNHLPIAIARHFHVSERLIQATLYNNHVIDQASFEQMVDAA